MPGKRSCDARCHDGTGKRCRCWCGGYFHGRTAAGVRELLREEPKLLETLLQRKFQLETIGTVLSFHLEGFQPVITKVQMHGESKWLHWISMNPAYSWPPGSLESEDIEGA